MNSPLQSASHYRPVTVIEQSGREVARCFTDVAGEYDAARTRAAVFARTDRCLLEVTGRDRAAWLHNLVSNAVKDAAPGSGVYAFALDVKGRIQFDLNILVRPEALWLDVDARLAAAALRHLDRYHISEQVTLVNRSAEFVQFGVAGPEAGKAAAALHAPDFASWPALTSRPTDSVELLFHHDFAGVPGFEVLVPVAAAPTLWDRLVGELGLAPAGYEALNVLRIEAGIPWPITELNDQVTPAETGQLARAVSFNKGCYLGQEVVERMRSHGALARRLVKLGTDGAVPTAPPLPIQSGGAEVGRLTSLVAHPSGAGQIGLGYLKTSVTEAAELSVGEPPFQLRLLPA